MDIDNVFSKNEILDNIKKILNKFNIKFSDKKILIKAKN